jgi:hypothetical protein
VATGQADVAALFIMAQHRQTHLPGS